MSEESCRIETQALIPNHTDSQYLDCDTCDYGKSYKLYQSVCANKTHHKYLICYCS